MIVLSILACTQTLSTDPLPADPLPTEPARRWVPVLARPCALDSEGELTCWAAEQWVLDGNLPHGPVDGVHVDPERRISGFYSYLYSHLPGEVPQVVHCPPRAAKRYCAPWRAAASFDSIGGVTVDGALFDLDGVAEASRGRTWRILTHGGRTTGLDENNVATAIRWNDYGLLEVPLPPELEITHLATAIIPPWVVDGVWLFGVCALDVDGEITCAGDGDMTTFPFTEGPYEDLQGYMGVACARRASDKVIVCSNGDVFDLGEVVTMSVDVRQHPGEDFDPALPSVCAITTDNAIRCAGPLYPADLLEQLEALPR